ncbi:MAG: hypothetical protein E6K17_01185 [Methanobacteriota archaeon]|nr:MAG: hypothetical protein E6K17_01185 [Euryarchaeota archaeon]
MRESLSAQWVQLASIAVLAMFLAPLPAVSPAEHGRYVIAEIAASGLGPILAAHAEVVQVYEGNLALLKATGSQIAQLRWDGVPITEVSDRTSIHFNDAGIRFDTSAGEPSFVPALRASDPHAFIVQFIGPIKAEWMDRIRSLGASPQFYVPNAAFVTRMDSGTARSVAALPFVNWVGPYHPAYKIPSALAGARGPTRISVMGFDDISELVLAKKVFNLGADVFDVAKNPPLVQAIVDGSRIPAIAGLEEVAVVFNDPLAHPLDMKAGIVHGFHLAWYKETSGLPTTLTGVSNPDGIWGNADDVYEIAGIQDTGLDEGSVSAGANDFFRGPVALGAQNDRVISFTDRTGCSVPDGAVGGRVAHGTHVAGIIASNGYSWERYLIEDRGDTSVSTDDFKWDRSEAGVAPQAKITFDGVNGCAGGVITSSQYWLDEYANGARVMVDSWGSNPGGAYDGFAQAADSQMDTGNDRLIEFSAGNDGPRYNTLGQQANLKNGLSIGASENFRPDQFEADNPDLIASFSSRGGPNQGSGRIKPDLVAIGTAVVSLFARGEWEAMGSVPQPDYILSVDKYNALALAPGSDGIPDYRYLQGTSMAGPMAAGLYLLAREYLREEKGIANPNSQLVKALLINGAVRMDPDLYAYPGWDQGWGRIDLPNSLFPKPPKTVQFQEGTIATTGATWNPTSINLNVASGTVPLKITLVWIDAIGPALVRDLNLQVTSPGGLTYCGNNYAAGWSRSFAGPTCAAGNTTWDTDGNGWDQVNNVEQVEVQSPAPGTWAVQVNGWNVPNAARFAVVVSADIGPQSQYRVALSTTSPTTFSIAPAGSANLPFHVANFGTSADSVVLTASTPGGITVRFSPTGPLSVPRAGGEDVLATIQVAAGVSPSLYQFNLQGTSNLDPNPAGPSSDFIQVTVEVTTTKVPFPIIVANGTTDELDPSVVVFNSTAGVRQMFVAYRRTGPVLLGGRLGGVNVWVAHTTLDNNGMPVLPFQQASVSSANDLPNDLRLLRIPTGTFADRVVITWTGTDPNVTNPDAASYGRIAYADAPYTTWNLRTIETNIGSSSFNVARVSFPLFRRAGTGNGELMWVFEHLDYVTLTGNPVRVQTHVTISIDGGNSWPVPIRIFPVSGADTNFYFFPHGTVDQNDVAWVFAYFRTPTGNNRDLALRLYDGIWSTTAPVVFNTVDNIQWPAVLSTAEGPFNNRVYAVVTRDNNAVDLKLWMVYINGTALPWSSARVPRAAPLGDNCGVGCSISLDFAGPYGPFGLSASNANYNRRPILNLVKTVEGANTFVWLPYMDNGNPYSTPNLWTYYGTEGSWVAKAPSLTKITSDGYAKGHQMTDTLTTGAVARLYEVYHASRTPETAVDYNIYLAIYSRNWDAAADLTGPLTINPASVPALVNLSQTNSMRIAANVNDVSTGNSTIAGAEFFFDVLGAPGTGRALVASDGAFDSPTEGVQTLAGVDPGWVSPSCHVLYIRGLDAAGNWGPPSQTQVCIQGSTGPDTTPPIPAAIASARLAGATLADVAITWRASTDEGFLGGTVKYQVFRGATLSGAFAQIGADITGVGLPTYTYTDVGVAPNTYFYYIRSVDGVGLIANSTQRAGRTQFAVAAGKNYVSLPLVQADESLGAVLQTLNVRGAWTYDGCSNAWSSWSSARPAGQNPFQIVSHRLGVILDLGAAGTFAVAGLVPVTTTFSLCKGWNFVGNPSFRTAYTVANLRFDTGASAVLGFSPVTPGNTIALADTTVLQAGVAYWVKVGGSSLWIVPGQ